MSDPVPFMTTVVPVRIEQRARIPAVVHADGSGRVQTVSVRDNSRCHRLLSAFQVATGVPILLNTSFNENEPIVCTADEALACFLRTGMDMLVLNNYVIAPERAQTGCDTRQAC